MFDIETTGLSALNNHITEIGAVKISEGEVKGVFGTFVNPGEHIPEEITKLTGITDEMVADAPSEAEAVKSFLEFAGGDILVAHNASFDIGFIRRVADREGYPFPNTYVDTVAMSRYVNPKLQKHKLDIIAEHYGFGDFDHPRAHEDAAVLANFIVMREAPREALQTLADVARWPKAPTPLLKRITDNFGQKPHGLKNLYNLSLRY